MGSKIIRKAEIDRGVIQLPTVICRNRVHSLRRHPGIHDCCPRHPTIVIDAAITNNLEILRVVPFFRAWIIECIHQAGSLHWNLWDAIDHGWHRQIGRFKNRGGHIIHVRELSPHTTTRLDAFRPMNHRAIACSTEITSNLFGESKG